MQKERWSNTGLLPCMQRVGIVGRCLLRVYSGDTLLLCLLEVVFVLAVSHTRLASRCRKLKTELDGCQSHSLPRAPKGLGPALDRSPYQIHSDFWVTIPKRLEMAHLKDCSLSPVKFRAKNSGLLLCSLGGIPQFLQCTNSKALSLLTFIFISKQWQEVNSHIWKPSFVLCRNIFNPSVKKRSQSTSAIEA